MAAGMDVPRVDDGTLSRCMNEHSQCQSQALGPTFGMEDAKQHPYFLPISCLFPRGGFRVVDGLGQS